MLGTKHGATQQEVKKAYRRLVEEVHPDKNKASDAKDRFLANARATSSSPTPGGAGNTTNTASQRSPFNQSWRGRSG